MELDIMPYCDNCPYFAPEKKDQHYYGDGKRRQDAPNIIYCRRKEICKRVEMFIKGEKDPDPLFVNIP